MTSRVNFAVEVVSNANEAAADFVTLHLNSKKGTFGTKLRAKEQFYHQKRNLQSSMTLEEIQDSDKARKLLKYNWPEKMVYVTLGLHCIFIKSSNMTCTDISWVWSDKGREMF